MLKIAILGANGMLGASLYRYFSNKNYQVSGSVRDNLTKEKLLHSKGFNGIIVAGVNAMDLKSVKKYLNDTSPDIILNCIGIIKQKEANTDPSTEIYINSVLPHTIAQIATHINSKLIHFSTDCVFNGEKGNYYEVDFADANDVYGRSKFLGEVMYNNHLTLRTSIIGHELFSNSSLIDWFLSQDKCIKGYNNAIFSGMPTCYIASIVENIIETAIDTSGLYHLSVDPIDKYLLLNIVKNTYNKDIEITKYPDFYINRSLNSDRLREKISFTPLPWDKLVSLMHNEYKQYFIEKI